MANPILDSSSYDEVPYPSFPMPQTHPRHLQTIGCLLGLNPPEIDRCRVLELGCGNGGNLIPMALSLPESQFLGIDLSAVQIEAGRQQTLAIELKNIELRHLSVLDFDKQFGEFDFIICHGVYSWVPAEIQSKILGIFSQQLAGDGIGFISYNTHPGWHQWGVIRKMMNFHVDRDRNASPTERIRQAKQLLEFLVRATPAQQQSYGMLLREQLEILQRLPDAYLFHEHLEEFNEPVWFLDFCDELTVYGLRYLAESDFSSMVASTAFSAAVQNELEEFAPNLLDKEQYMDFIRNRSFRQTLVCHGHQQPNYDVRAERIFELSVASPVRPISECPDLISDEPEVFATTSGASIQTPLPIFKAALVCLREVWPAYLPFVELLQRAMRRLELVSPETAVQLREFSIPLARSLLTAFASSSQPLVQLVSRAPQFVTALSHFPFVHPLARLQAAKGDAVVNLRHEVVDVLSLDRALLVLLDGSLASDGLVDELFSRLALSDSERDTAQGDFWRDSTNDDDRRQLLKQRLETLLASALFQS